MAPVYLVDFSVYKPPEELRVKQREAEEKGKKWSVSARPACPGQLLLSATCLTHVGHQHAAPTAYTNA